MQSDVPRPLRTNTLVESVFILLALTAIQRLVGFCRAMLFCRWLTPEQLGVWDMAFSFLILASPLAVLSLPGTFGRYVERFRKKGQLRPFFRRTSFVCATMLVLTMLIIALARPWFSQLVFGVSDQTELILIVAVVLGSVTLYNFLIELFTALRNVRLIATLELVNSIGFAVISACLLLGWQATAKSVVIAYGTTCLLTASVSLLWMRRVYLATPIEKEPLSNASLWSKLAPFAAWVLLTNLLTNLFNIVDRYMIIHYSTMTPDEALIQVGNYHSSRIIPLLLVSIAGMLSTMITPHFSADWESDRRDRIHTRLNLFVKLFGFSLCAAGVAILFIAPFLFEVAFRGKLNSGLQVLPWTLTYCVWMALTWIVSTYLWCAEKARLAGWAVFVGLILNIILNLILLPRLGLIGAVLATTIANLVTFGLSCMFNHMLGFKLNHGAQLIVAIPILLAIGPWPMLIVLIGIAVVAARSNWLLTKEEKQLIGETLTIYRNRLKPNADAN